MKCQIEHDVNLCLVTDTVDLVSDRDDDHHPDTVCIDDGDDDDARGMNKDNTISLSDSEEE